MYIYLPLFAGVLVSGGEPCGNPEVYVASEKNNLKKEKKRAWELLVLIKKILEKNNIPYWIESGTLLGFIRENDFLNTFQNINIGIRAEHLDSVTCINPYSISRLGWRLKPLIDRSGCFWIDGEICSVYTKPLLQIGRIIRWVDAVPLYITPRFIVGDSARWVEGSTACTCKSISSHFYQTLNTCAINGISFPIPQDTENYLSQRYGNWKNRRKTWNTHTDDKTIAHKDVLSKLPQKTRIVEKDTVKPRLKGKDRRKAEVMLRDTVAILEKNNIPYWLDAGTLLGIIRDNELIPWDYDIDISVSSDYAEWVIALKNQFLPKYRLVSRILKPGRLPGKYRACKVKLTLDKLTFFNKKEGLHCDIFFKYKVDNFYCWIDSNTTKRVDARFHDTLDTVSWKGKTYSIPSDVEGYLTQRYGEWRTPNENYDASIHDRAIYI